MSNDPNLKRSQQIVRAMTREIIALGWPVGHLLGREAELLERWHVSRAVFREAVAIAEKQGLIEMRRGRTGGLAVKSTPAECASTTICRYLITTGFDGAELSQARGALEELLIHQACARIDSVAAARLRALPVEAGGNFEQAFRHALALVQELAAVGGNPCLSILIDAMAKLTYWLLVKHGVPAATLSDFAHRTLMLRRAQIEAVIGNDLGAAFTLQRQLDESRDAILQPLKSATDVLDTEAGAELLDERQSRLADEFSASLLAEIRQHDRPAGTAIGTQQSLMESYGISRGVLRAAIRRLEQIGAVRMEAGRSGGLQVATPAPDMTIQSAIIYINCTNPSIEDVVATQERLELAAITLTTRSGRVIGSQLESLLHPAVPTEQALHEFGRSHFLALAEASGNRVLLLLIRILAAQLSANRYMNRESPRRVFNEYLLHLREVVAAVQAGDVALARRATTEIHRFIASLDLQRLSPDEIGELTPS